MTPAKVLVFAKVHTALRPASRIAICSSLLITASCLPVTEGARNEFAKQYTCPPEQVTVKRRADVLPHQLLGASLTPIPPEDVASDPNRLRYWQKGYAEKLSSLDQSCEVYEVVGCGQKAVMCCAHALNADGNPMTGAVTCTGSPLVLLIAPPGS